MREQRERFADPSVWFEHDDARTADHFAYAAELRRSTRAGQQRERQADR
jgi:hypothetical protein